MCHPILKKSSIVLILIFSLYVSATAQEDSSPWEGKPAFSITGFTEVFYAYDFNEPVGNRRHDFLYSHNRHNEFNLNIGFVNLALQHKKYRVMLTMQTGTYAVDNYAQESGVMQNIYEAYAGLSLNKSNTLWLDIGVMPSHIGFESAISLDNKTLTRSLIAENTPYYSTGAKLSFEPNDKWTVAAVLVNGWQRIQRLEGNSMLSIGTQLSFKPRDGMLFNWSTFYGTDDPDISRRKRFLSNFFAQVDLSDRWSFDAGFDWGNQQSMKDSSEYDVWFGPILIVQYNINNHWSAAFRYEYYDDETGIIISAGPELDFKTTGISLNLDYTPVNDVSFRVEGRWFDSQGRIFISDGSPSNSNFAMTASMAIRFSSLLN